VGWGRGVVGWWENVSVVGLVATLETTCRDRSMPPANFLDGESLNLGTIPINPPDEHIQSPISTRSLPQGRDFHSLNQRKPPWKIFIMYCYLGSFDSTGALMFLNLVGLHIVERDLALLPTSCRLGRYRTERPHLSCPWFFGVYAELLTYSRALVSSIWIWNTSITYEIWKWEGVETFGKPTGCFWNRL